jgi:hypothetical protein
MKSSPSIWVTTLLTLNIILIKLKDSKHISAEHNMHENPVSLV